MATIREREEEKRKEKLEHIQKQVADGSLVIRQMTPEERKENKPRPPKRKGRA